MIEVILVSILKAMCGVTLIMAAWLLVQWSWNRIFATASDQDALAGRLGCHGCHCEAPCENKNSLQPHVDSLEQTHATSRL